MGTQPILTLKAGLRGARAEKNYNTAILSNPLSRRGQADFFMKEGNCHEENNHPDHKQYY
jgi:hypothetical protein